MYTMQCFLLFETPIEFKLGHDMLIFKMAIFVKVDYVEIETVIFAIYVDVDIMHRIKEKSNSCADIMVSYRIKLKT